MRPLRFILSLLICHLFAASVSGQTPDALLDQAARIIESSPTDAQLLIREALSQADDGQSLAFFAKAHYLDGWSRLLLNQSIRGTKALERGLPYVRQIADTSLLLDYYQQLAHGYLLRNNEEKYHLYDSRYNVLAQQLLVRQKQSNLDSLNEQLVAEQELSSSIQQEAIQSRQQVDSTQELLTIQNEELLRQNLELTELQMKIAEADKQKMEVELAAEKQQKVFQLWTAGSIILSLLVIGFFLLRYQRKARQRDLAIERERSDKLEQIDKLKDQFLANTSHELRTPLNGIIGLTEGLIDRLNEHRSGQSELSAEDLDTNLRLVVASGRRLGSLVNDLLDFSRIRNADLILRKKPTDLASIIKVVLRVSEPLANGKSLELINDLPDLLPPVLADEDRVTQVLHNLIGNAIKFSNSGTVRVSATHINDMVRVEVSDTGIGIDSAKLQDIFEAFQQADGSISRSYSGSGLGLSISKSLVEQHGGKIWASSIPGEGSTFYFTLPVSTEPAISSEMSVSDLPVSTLFPGTAPDFHPDLSIAEKEGNAENIRILIVDDEPINHQVLRQHLRSPRFEVHSAMNGAGAISLIREAEIRFDLVLLDVMMPGMSGYEVAQNIRTTFLPSELPIIMITAKNQVSDLVQGLQIGANDYLAKPFTKDEFLARLSTHLNLQRISNATKRFVPTEFIRTLGKETITDVQLGDFSSQEISVLFSDIREYTSIAEQLSPADNFKLVKSYSARMGPVIQKNKGFVNQYLGDGIMALFQHSPADALQAAIDMQTELRKYNHERRAKGWKALRVGMGIHTGPLIMGIIGDDYRSDPAVISDTVNTTARLEGLTKYYGANILLSEESFSILNTSYASHTRHLGLVQVKGRQKPMAIFECFAGDEEELIELKQSTLGLFSECIRHFLEGRMDEAAAGFGGLARKGDPVSQRFLSQSLQYRSEGLPETWSGVEIMESK